MTTTPNNDLTALAARMQEAQADEQETLLIQAWAVIGTSMGEPYNRFCWMIEAGSFESAALMLVPQGWGYQMKQYADDDDAEAIIWGGGGFDPSLTSDARSPALAIASAALLAHVENSRD